jgi:integrase
MASRRSAKELTKLEVLAKATKGVYERGVGTSQPYFQVRIRHRGHKEVSKSFPYLPAEVTALTSHSRDAFKHTEKFKTREAAHIAAMAFAASEKSTFHFYGKPSADAMTEATLREWITAWIREACDRLLEDGRSPADHIQERLGADKDKRAMLGYIRMADEYAHEHTRRSVMDTRIIDLVKADFNGPHGLLRMVTGRKIKGKDEKRPAARGTQKRFLAMMSVLWEHAKEYWNSDIKKPFQGVRLTAKEGKPVARSLKMSELDAIEVALSEVSKPVLAAIYFLRWTGARSGEMRKLRWEHVHWPNAENGLTHPAVTFIGTKTPRRGAYRERTVVLAHEDMVAPLRMLFDAEKGPPTSGVVFESPTSPGSPLPENSAYQAWTRAIERAGVPHARLHDLRHTRTTEISVTLEKAQAMKITGHTDERTFMHYTHMAAESQEAIARDDAKRKARFKASLKNEVATEPVDVNSLMVLAADLTTEQRMALISALASQSAK